MDYHTLLATLPALRRHRAQLRLEAAAAIRLGHGGPEVQLLASTTEREAKGEV